MPVCSLTARQEDKLMKYEVFAKVNDTWKLTKSNLSKEAAINAAEVLARYEFTPARVFTQGKILGRMIHETAAE